MRTVFCTEERFLRRYRSQGQSNTYGGKKRLTCALLVHEGTSQEGHKEPVKVAASREKDQGIRGGQCGLFFISHQ